MALLLYLPKHEIQPISTTISKLVVTDVSTNLFSDVLLVFSINSTCMFFVCFSLTSCKSFH